MKLRTFFGASALALVVSASLSNPAAAEKFTCESDRGESPYAIAATPDHDHDRYAPNQKEIIKRFGAYVSSFDGDDDDDGDGKGDLLAVPQWVAYELKGLKPKANGEFEEPDISINRPNDWYKEPKFAFLWTDRAGVTKSRIDNSYDGIGSIWNRGHLAMADHAQRISWQASCNTHFFWNAVPQAADMNQGPWRHLEDYSAAASNKYERLWIIAGSVIEKGKPIGFIGETSKGEVPVAVPHALFKVIVRETGNGKVDALAFLFPQAYAPGADGQPRPTEKWVNCNKAKGKGKGKGHVYDHKPRLKTVAEIENMTGLTFFPGAANREEMRTRQAAALWQVEEKFWDPKGCAGQRYVP
tara:strand:+ start:8451 stop:9518 length:1068 start_codon:yes stop_codon:yes gene_type:complete